MSYSAVPAAKTASSASLIYEELELSAQDHAPEPPEAL